MIDIGEIGSGAVLAWGGEGDDKPFRDLIPRRKQRCRYISTRFRHLNAREFFTILGITLTMRPLSTRAYRKVGA